MKKVAIVGTQGVPAMYGGFETLVENIIGRNTYDNIEYTVFCSSKDYKVQLKSYKGARLIYIPVHANGIYSTLYDIVSMIKAIGKFDVIVILGVSGCIFLPLFRLLFRGKIIVNIDGLEYKRAKWGKVAKCFLFLSEIMAVKFSDVVVADNKGIQDYVRSKYRKKAELIAYGGDHVNIDLESEEEYNILRKYNLTPNTYSLTVCRIEPENNCHMILEAFAKNTKQFLVYVGNWRRCEYSKGLAEKYSNFENILILHPIYDLEELYALRRNCKSYIHGHSAGGTNPSLVEAMFFGVPILSFDVVYNRETTDNKAHYFSSSKDLYNLIENVIDIDFTENGNFMRKIAQDKYTWDEVANQYEQLY